MTEPAGGSIVPPDTFPRFGQKVDKTALNRLMKRSPPRGEDEEIISQVVLR